MNGWISVDDYLPEIGQQVLVLEMFFSSNEGRYGVAFINERQEIWESPLTGETLMPRFAPTHWQPLPPLVSREDR